MPKRNFRIYECHDLDGNLIAKGTAIDIGWALGVSDTYVYKAVSAPETVRKGIVITLADEQPESEKERRARHRISLHKLNEKDPEGLEYLKLHLITRKLDNTITTFDPFPFLPEQRLIRFLFYQICTKWG